MNTAMTEAEHGPHKVVEGMMKMNPLMRALLSWIIITVICTSNSAKTA